MGVAMLGLGALLVLRGRFGLTVGDVAAFATVLDHDLQARQGARARLGRS